LATFSWERKDIVEKSYFYNLNANHTHKSVGLFPESSNEFEMSIQGRKLQCGDIFTLHIFNYRYLNYVGKTTDLT